jgi:hypothetical protein
MIQGKATPTMVAGGSKPNLTRLMKDKIDLAQC